MRPLNLDKTGELEPQAEWAGWILLIYTDAHRRDEILDGLGPDARVNAVHETDAADIAGLVANKRPDILIWDMQDEAGGADTVEKIFAASPLPIIVFSSDPEPGKARLALQAGVSVYVVDGLKSQRVPTLIEIAKERFRLTNALHEELRRSKEELAARKSIERAKGLLMERRNLTEREAYDAMRRMAMAQGKTVHAIAETILSISDILP